MDGRLKAVNSIALPEDDRYQGHRNQGTKAG